MGGISIWQLLIILLIVVLLFGSKRLRSLGSDLGSAIRGFKKSVDEPQNEKKEPGELNHKDQKNEQQEKADGKPEKKDEKTGS